MVFKMEMQAQTQCSNTNVANEIIVRVFQLGGNMFTFVGNVSMTVWHLKDIVKSALGIAKKNQVFLFGDRILASGTCLNEFQSNGSIDLTIIVVVALCHYCGCDKRLKRCLFCDCYYCCVECQRRDWRLHKGECTAIVIAKSNNYQINC